MEIRLESVWKCRSFLTSKFMSRGVSHLQKSDLNQSGNVRASDLNLFWIRSESVLTQTWNVQSSCRRVQSITRKWLPGFQETLPRHLNLAPRSHIREKGDQIHPLFRVYQNMRLIFSWNSRPSKAQKDLIHLARKPKMAKPTLTLFRAYDT